MKRISYLLIVLALSHVVHGQNVSYELAIEIFETNYNLGNYEAIFESFSPEMQQALPLENTKQFLTGLASGAGKMQGKKFINEDETGVNYKAEFEKTSLLIYISLNDQDKFNTLLIKPYHEESKTENSVINALDSYPVDVAETIFSKTSQFPNNTQLSIAIIKNGETKYYGVVKENDSIKAIENQNIVFEIGSITKIFTATVLASLVSDNSLKLNDNINSYYSFPFKNNTKLTFESLANHTSGLPRLPGNIDLSNVNNPYKAYGKIQIEDYLKLYLKLNNDTLKTYDYSNLGAGLLGYTLGLTRKTSFQDLLQKRVLNKYGMTNSYTGLESLDQPIVKGRDEKGNIVSNWEFDVLFAAGGILSTTEDLAKFANAHFNSENSELALTRKSTFTVNDQMRIGLGWHILKSESSKDLFWHNGGTGGYSSSMILDAESGFSVIILSNMSSFSSKSKSIDGLCFELTKKLNDN